MRRTVYRDLDALQYAGFPVVSEKRDGRVFYRFLDSFGLGDVPFTPDEVLALAFGEDLLRPLEGTVFHDSIRSALAKIRAALGPELGAFVERLGESFRVLPGPHKRYARYREMIQALNEAVLGRRSVRMSYRTGRTGRGLDAARSTPTASGTGAAALYVIGHDHRSGEVRTFAVDRIGCGGARARSASRCPASFDFDAYTASAFGVVAEPADPGAHPLRPALRAPRGGAPAGTRARSSSACPGGGLELVLEVGGLDELRSLGALVRRRRRGARAGGAARRGGGGAHEGLEALRAGELNRLRSEGLSNAAEVGA